MARQRGKHEAAAAAAAAAKAKAQAEAAAARELAQLDQNSDSDGEPGDHNTTPDACADAAKSNQPAMEEVGGQVDLSVN